MAVETSWILRVAPLGSFGGQPQCLAQLGFDAVDNTPQQFTAYIREEVTKWAKVIKESGARVD
jgi:hypothetical protein